VRRVAGRLRRLADWLEPPPAQRPPAPLIRLGGRWWRRDEIGRWAGVEAQDRNSS
jgi:hypothetical protein